MLVHFSSAPVRMHRPTGGFRSHVFFFITFLSVFFISFAPALARSHRQNKLLNAKKILCVARNRRQPSVGPLRMDVTVPVYRRLCFPPDLCQGDAPSLVFKPEARARALTRARAALWRGLIAEFPRGELRDKV